MEVYELVVLATEECLDPPTGTIDFDSSDDRLLRVKFSKKCDTLTPSILKFGC